ncbi:hypothetical protein AGABI1DRAFT_100687 [Agaricus bisporus var. burnettii JB137-S8]|uniref:Tyrosine specific protein phosphatases domain-containing protein n=1 Tax=Agaricus bisporus var. burnettii (strain JB137-S8 / ATCC MYA-4627 / FGSC 10392) TaxID=597362 RepID=K5X649_AGABU|nr:uncharacterized protein AGABI1DRAFT_100687 [Agaricus bisporus var. burnettii JB137-S8]EKM78648.1 hypothetical protein AGABI1DRAFT_100687 [Agaricus bisporus var. burnettii JB137-S8]
MNSLQRAEGAVVKTRSGSVLSRGFILKTDHYPSGRALDLDLNVHGAPNFRAPRIGDLNVFGVAQPRTQGLRAILSILRCRPNTPNPSHVVWFSTREEPIVYISGRPFVFRDAAEPRRTLNISDRAENLEAIETRLKNDILQEAARFGGVLLTHNEVATDTSGDGPILPTWTSVDINNVKTSRELWASMKKEGWNVDDNYLDAYLRVIRDTDPLHTSLVFNCGMGAVRTTFAMVAALIIRRKQLVERGFRDPFGISPGPSNGVPAGADAAVTESRLIMALEQANAQQEYSKSLLRLTYLLQKSLKNTNSQSAIELLLSQPTLLENLRKAHQGSYGIILSLLGCLDHGLGAKKLVDKVIDATDQVTNLREDILNHRLLYSLTSLNDEQGEIFLNKAAKALEKYFFMIVFASFIEASDKDFTQSFLDWITARTEIGNQVRFLRKTYGSKLHVFAPINDLSSLSKSGSASRSHVAGKKNDMAIAGGQILGDEYTDHVIKNRSGIILRESTLLKSDQWLRRQTVEDSIRGAINFRSIPNSNIYALGQPTVEAVDDVISKIKHAHGSAPRIVWITLREEPVVYINGAPYCLRREGFSLRNMKDYGGISASRLEILEERLKDDVIAESKAFGGRVLLHTETTDGTVVPVWEEVVPENVAVLKDIMEARDHAESMTLQYNRIPITAEKPPDFADLSELIEVVMRTSMNTPIVVNCQLGGGRSTLASILLVLIRQWLENQPATTPNLASGRSMQRAMSMTATESIGFTNRPKPRKSYQAINNLLRVIRKGPAVKSTVDDAIDQCSAFYNLRESIDILRVKSEEATEEGQRKEFAQKGLQNLRRYFELIVFQSYLQSTIPDTMQSFESVETFVKNRPVIKTFEKELISGGLSALQPLTGFAAKGDMANPDEETQVVMSRSGSILSASTILKSDFFSNLQKMTLPERIEGAPNFRRVPLTLRPIRSKAPGSDASNTMDFALDDSERERMVCGSGMPTVEGLKRALQRVDAGPEGKNMVFWTSLREEPVVYVAGRPHVLRLVNKPLENVEATGVTTAVVESMEEGFKKDVLREMRAGDGRILLHDEVEEHPGVFSIIPIWEMVTEDDIMTPRDVVDLIKKEGYRIDYGRIAITDEQAPLPVALSQLLDRVQSGPPAACDFVFNCQMGRGRTTTGMVTACLIASTQQWTSQEQQLAEHEPMTEAEIYDPIDGPSEEEAYLQGEYKTILHLVGVLSHGKVAKRLTDRAIDLMQDVQNLRKAIYDYKLKAEACEKGSAKERNLRNTTVNYLYRYGTLIAFANYLIAIRERGGSDVTFPEWLHEHREITKLLERRSLD